MTEYVSEAVVTGLIDARLADAGFSAKASFHSDTQSGNTIVRECVFKVAVALENSESVVNALHDIGTDTDRGISYKGSQVEPSNEGEMRYLFFTAKINPEGY